MKATFTLILVCFLLVSYIIPTSAKRSKTVNYPDKIGLNMQASSSERASKQIFFNSSRVKSEVLLKSAQAIKQRLDSIIEEELDSISKQIRLSSKTVFKYNAAGNVTQEIYYNWDKVTSKWIGDWKFETSWNAQGKPFQTIESEWNVIGKKWVNSYKSDITYTTNGLISSEISSEWDTAAEKWMNSYKVENTYNAGGNVSQQINYMFDKDKNQWQISMKYTYTYDSSGKLTLQSGYLSDGGTEFQFSKSEYIYNANGTLKQITGSTSNFMGGWNQSSKNEFTYDGSDNLVLEIYYESNQQNTGLIATWKDEYIFDSNGNLLQEINHEWDDAGKKWFIDSKSVFTYNNSYSYNDLLLPYNDIQKYFRHMITSASYEELDKSTGSLVLTGKMTPFYSSVNISGLNEILANELIVFPNPANDFITIGLDGLNQQILVELFDLKGSKVVSRSVFGNEKISVNQLKSGVYLCQIHFNNQVINAKVVKK